MRLTLFSSAYTAVILSALSCADGAQAQAAVETVTVIPDNSDTNVSVGDYYSQVQLSVGSGFKLPNDDNGKKQLGKSLLNAFGLDKKTRSITISAVMSNDGKVLPEVSLVTYIFESDGRISDIKISNEYISPRWQLDAGSAVSITLRYTYSEKLEIDPKQVSDDIAKLIPSNTIVSALGGTFIQGVAGLAGSVYGAAGTRKTTNTQTNLLLPYSGSVGVRKIKYDLKLPNGTQLGAITAALLASPSLGRTAKLATQVLPSDINALPTDDAAELAMDLSGSRKYFLSELLGTKEFAALTREQTAATVTAHCAASQSRLQGYALTRLDRNLLLIQTMLNAGFKPGIYQASVNDWLQKCFPSAADRTFLNQSMGFNIALPTAPDEPRIDPTNWPRQLKDAMGCHMRKVTGPWCERNAPTATATLLEAMSDQVKIGVVELTSIDTSELPQGRMWEKTTLLDRLRNKVDQFSCYEAGLILTEMGMPYLVSVEMRANLVTGIAILRAPEDAGQCLS